MNAPAERCGSVAAAERSKGALAMYCVILELALTSIDTMRAEGEEEAVRGVRVLASWMEDRKEDLLKMAFEVAASKRQDLN